MGPTAFGWLPNFLTAIRAGLAAPVLGAAALGSKLGFFVLILIALGTEVDGAVARRLGATSNFGRLFDSWADLVLQVAALTGLVLLFPEFVTTHLHYFVAAVLALTVPIGYGLVSRGEPLGFHSDLARCSGAVAGVAAIWFIGWGRFEGLRAAVLVELAVAVEYLSIAALIPHHRGPVRSLRHAFVLRRGTRPS